jgi:hypothetical protein
MKHVGRLKTTGNNVIVVNRTLPGDALSSLVIDRDSLRPLEQDIIGDLLESADGQAAFEFGHMLGRHRMPLEDSPNKDAADKANSIQGISVLEHLHTSGQLLKQPTENVLMIEEGADAVQLDKLNEIIAEQKGVRIEGLAISADTTASGDSRKTEAKLMMSRAGKLQHQVDVFLERAYELDPELRPKKGRPKKQSN